MQTDPLPNGATAAIDFAHNPDGLSNLLENCRGLEGMESAGARVEPDREKAIRRAYEETRDGDRLVVAGKGHETYQLIGDKKLPFSDEKVVRSLS